ncbi:MAG TPA: hypothetical protein VFT53_01890 [Candidatus Saccharimonadales bacterium]|nr:hypothetical protein [Candidatus Saccharimonadales bacterium]
MKQKDIALILLIAGLSGVASYAISHFIFATPANRQQQVAVVSPVNTAFASPDPKYFNNQSIDPSELIVVGGSNNANPFNGTGQ